jgi:hypothetical protein
VSEPGGELVADASALLASVGALPLEPPTSTTLLAPDGALVDVLSVLRAIHVGRHTDVLGDLAVLGLRVRSWLPTFRVATSLATLALDHPDEPLSDLLAVAMARDLGATLVTGHARLALLEPDAIVLARRDA